MLADQHLPELDAALPMGGQHEAVLAGGEDERRDDAADVDVAQHRRVLVVVVVDVMRLDVDGPEDPPLLRVEGDEVVGVVVGAGPAGGVGKRGGVADAQVEDASRLVDRWRVPEATTTVDHEVAEELALARVPGPERDPGEQVHRVDDTGGAALIVALGVAARLGADIDDPIVNQGGHRDAQRPVVGKLEPPDLLPRVGLQTEHFSGVPEDGDKVAIADRHAVGAIGRDAIVVAPLDGARGPVE